MSAAHAVVDEAKGAIWHCELCGFTYDEARGYAPEGFPPGTLWADVPESWGCPDCGQPKADFHPLDLV